MPEHVLLLQERGIKMLLEHQKVISQKSDIGTQVSPEGDKT
jgi:hypothetical protein